MLCCAHPALATCSACDRTGPHGRRGAQPLHEQRRSVYARTAQVQKELEFSKHTSNGNGMCLLFYGPPVPPYLIDKGAANRNKGTANRMGPALLWSACPMADKDAPHVCAVRVSTGPSGTGKTMMANAVAASLKKKVRRWPQLAQADRPCLLRAPPPLSGLRLKPKSVHESLRASGRRQVLLINFPDFGTNTAGPLRSDSCRACE